MVLSAVGNVKAFVNVKSQPTYAEFSTTSTVLVDVTDATGYTITDGHTSGFVYYDKVTTFDAIKTIQVQIITTDDVTQIYTRTNVASSGFVRDTFIGVKNSTGGVLTLKMRIKSSVASLTSTIQANTTIGHSFPLRNITDLFIVAGVTSIRIWGTAAEGINGIVNDATSDDFQLITVNAVMKQFVWSANSGNVLWDWSGTEVTLTS